MSRAMESTLSPLIKRARGFFLYTEDGHRLIDLWQYGGYSLLGHNPDGLLASIKAAAARGLYGPMPSVWEGRLRRSLKRLFPGFPAIYIEAGAATETREALGLDSPAAWLDPSSSAIPKGADKAFWRPWAPFPELDEAYPALIRPILPTPLASLFTIVLGRDKRLDALKPSLPPAPLFLAAACRACDLLRVAMAGGGSSGTDEPPPREARRRSASAKRLDRTLRPRADAASRIWAAAATSPSWIRRGIYLRFRSKDAVAYVERRTRFLESGFLLPPTLDEPLIIPAELSERAEGSLLELIGV